MRFVLDDHASANDYGRLRGTTYTYPSVKNVVSTVVVHG